jgi:predicted porin
MFVTSGRNLRQSSVLVFCFFVFFLEFFNMKKSLIALAVLAASGASFAQSSVTLYGVADVWLGSSKVESNVNGVNSSLTTTRLDSNGVSTSRFGFKGSEDLGGGLKANFQLEQGINVDTGSQGHAGVAFDRQSWVGLSGGFGEVQLGKTWSPYDDVRSTNNDTFNANIAASFNTWVGYQDRLNNSIKYQSPNFGGFSGAVSYSLGEDNKAGVSASRIAAIGGLYANGPVSVGVAYQEQTQTGGVNSTFSALPGFGNNNLFGLAPQLAASFTGKTKYALINGSYDFGVAKLIGGYNKVDQDVNVGAVADKYQANEFNLGVEVPLAANMKLGAGYAESKLKGNGTDFGKTKGFSAALTYSLSKRTTVYGALTNTKFDAIGANINAKSELYAVGVNHTF